MRDPKMATAQWYAPWPLIGAGSLPEPESQVALGWDSAKTARSAANTIIVLQTPTLILINLQLFGRRCRELLFVWVCGLTATLTSEVRNYWRDGLTEFGLEQTMLAALTQKRGFTSKHSPSN